MLVSRRSPGKLISAGSWRGVRVQVCRRALPHFDSASGTVVSKNLGVSIVGRGPRAAHKKGREPVPAMRRSAGPPGGKAMWAPGSYASVPSARLPTSQTQQASSRATATLATQGRLPAAPRDSCLRRRRAVALSQRRFTAAGTAGAGRRRLGLRRARLEVPRRLDEGAPGGGVPGLGDAALGLLLAARVLGGREAEPGGVGAGGGEPGEAPRLGGQAERRDGVDALDARRAPRPRPLHPASARASASTLFLQGRALV